jgi:DNA modification methylase
MKNQVINADVLTGMKSLEDNSIDCIITSPPYYQLRDYGFSEQWGLEKTYQEYLNKMISWMKECKRVIKDSGSIWINLGDSYGTVSGNMKQGNVNNNKIKYSGSIENYTKPENMEKCLMLIPHRFAIRCVDELGLILRNDIIWAKPNGMPESVTDRFSKKHEFFFFFVKSKKYYFDLDGVRSKNQSIDDLNRRKNKYWSENIDDGGTGKQNKGRSREDFYNPNGKNPGDVADFWSITTKGSSEKHYATFNSELIDKPIVAGSPEFVCVKCGVPREKILENNNKSDANIKGNMNENGLTRITAGLSLKTAEEKKANYSIVGLTDCGCNAGFTGGIVLDPFAGTGTTLIRALELGRNVIGIEGKKEYSDIATKRIDKELLKINMFA